MTSGSSGRSGGGAAAALDAILRILAGRAVTEHEARVRLARRGFDAAAIGGAVAEARSRGYLDDRSLAYTVASSRAQRLYGKARALAELRRRGISAVAAAEAVEAVFADLDEDALAREAAAKLRKARAGRASGPGAARSLAGALLRRGFSHGAAGRALAGAQADAAGAAGPEDWAGENDEPELEADP